MRGMAPRRSSALAAVVVLAASLLAGCAHAWDPSVDGYDVNLKNIGSSSVTIAFCDLSISDCAGKGTVKPGACRSMWFDPSEGLDGRGAQIQVATGQGAPGYVYIQPNGENLTYGLGPTWTSMAQAQAHPSAPISGGC